MDGCARWSPLGRPFDACPPCSPWRPGSRRHPGPRLNTPTGDIVRVHAPRLQPGNDHTHDRNAELRTGQVDRHYLVDTHGLQTLQLPLDIFVERVGVVIVNGLEVVQALATDLQPRLLDRVEGARPLI